MPFSEFDMTKSHRLKDCDKVLEWVLGFYTCFIKTKSEQFKDWTPTGIVRRQIMQVRMVFTMLKHGALLTWFKMVCAFFLAYFTSKRSIIRKISETIRGKRGSDKWIREESSISLKAR